MINFTDKREDMHGVSIEGIANYSALPRYYVRINYQNGTSLNIVSNRRVVDFVADHEVTPETIDYIITMIQEYYSTMKVTK